MHCPFMSCSNATALAHPVLLSRPCSPTTDPWWVVHVVNLTEGEYRQLDPAGKRCVVVILCWAGTACGASHSIG